MLFGITGFSHTFIFVKALAANEIICRRNAFA